jgi:hypothetical protein
MMMKSGSILLMVGALVALFTLTYGSGMHGIYDPIYYIFLLN